MFGHLRILRHVDCVFQSNVCLPCFGKNWDIGVLREEFAQFGVEALGGTLEEIWEESIAVEREEVRSVFSRA